MNALSSKQSSHGSLSLGSTQLSHALVINPTKIVFFTLFVLVFCLSGAITMLDMFPYRMGVMSLLALALVMLYGIKTNSILLSYLLLTLVIIISGILNGSPLGDIILFLRVIVFSYLTYYVTNRYIRQKNITSVINLCLTIGLVQLPIVVFQLLTYDWLPQRVKTTIAPVDYDFGTFNFKGDYSMSFFLILLVVFLLFDRKRNYIAKHRIWMLLWFTATVMIANSNVSKVILILVWLAYFARYLNRKTTMTLVFAGIFLVGFLFMVGIGEQNIDELHKSYDNIRTGLQGDPLSVQRYLDGTYSRGGAIYYYLNSEFLWFGDGPNRYSNPVTRELTRGNVGHVFTFYSEIGFLGWLLSMLIFALIALNYRKTILRVSSYSVLIFGVIVGMSFTSHIMNDISIVMIYCIMAKSHLIPTIGTEKQIRDNEQ